MYYLLFNPLAKSGKNHDILVKVIKYYKKRKEEIKVISVLDVKVTAETLNKIKENDSIVIIGGDGTLHKLLIDYDFKKLNNKIYMCKGGSGNDFARGHKGFIFDITAEVKNLPSFVINEQKHSFLNGVGMGIDAYVCQEVLKTTSKSYFKVALKALKSFKPISIKLDIDGIVNEYNNVYFFVVMNGKYIGRGMKIAPKAKRDDDKLDVVIVRSKGFKSLMLMFPLVFLGLHRFLRSKVTFIDAKSVKVINSSFNSLQADGEVINGVTNLTISV